MQEPVLTGSVIGVRTLVVVARMVMIMVTGFGQRRVLDVMQGTELAKHRPNHNSKHQQHQKTGAEYGWEIVGEATHLFRVRHARGKQQPRRRPNDLDSFRHSCGRVQRYSGRKRTCLCKHARHAGR